MMQRSGCARRQARNGKGLLPPNNKQWDYEHNALDLRDDLGLDTFGKLDHNAAFGLLPHVTVLPHGEIPAAAVHLNHFRGKNSGAWSGMGIKLPTGDELVVYNDSHTIRRIRATLMEEFFHIRLDHMRSAVRVYADDGRWRTYNSRTEEEAYHSGAAALLPYRALKQMADDGERVPTIAKHFEISPDLVIFRAKVTRCYKVFRKRN